MRRKNKITKREKKEKIKHERDIMQGPLAETKIITEPSSAVFNAHIMPEEVYDSVHHQGLGLAHLCT